MKVSFSYITVSFDNSTEDFWLQISTNGGSTYTTVADYNYSIEFTNGVRNNATVTIPGPFTANTRFRFRADASADDDVVYIDDVVITGCQTTALIGNDTETSLPELSAQQPVAVKGSFSDVRVSPNPASESCTVEFFCENATKLEYVLIDMTGRMVLQQDHACEEGSNRIDIDVRDLPRGSYILSMQTDKGRHTQKLVVSR
jgi:hypothetical protein